MLLSKDVQYFLPISMHGVPNKPNPFYFLYIPKTPNWLAHFTTVI